MPRPRTFRVEAIVLRRVDFGEADRVLHVYSLASGRVGAVAKGVRRTKSRFGGRLEPLSHVSLQLYDTGDGLRIEVEDANPAPPVTTDGHPGRVGGFGMQIVERLADWGWRQSRGGKLVWAKVRPGSMPTDGQ